MKSSQPVHPLDLSPESIVHLLRWRGENQKHRRALIYLEQGEDETDHLTYGALDRKARAIAAFLQQNKAQGERALILHPPGLEYVAAFMGCLYAGVIAVPAFPPRLSRPDPRIDAIIDDAEATYALTDSAVLDQADRRLNHTPQLKKVRWVATDTIDLDLADRWEERLPAADSLAYLQYTSGSTSTPKGVMVYHDNVLHNVEAIRSVSAFTPDQSSVTWLPTFHDMGLVDGVLVPLYTGALGVMMPPVAFVKRPIRWLRAISRYDAVHSGGPNMGYDLCVQRTLPEDRQGLDLSTWRFAYTGAEPIRPGTLRDFFELYSNFGFKRDLFYPCYGMAEATLIASGGDLTADPVLLTVDESRLQQGEVAPQSADAATSDGYTLVGCGSAIMDSEIAIVDPETRERCAPTQIGEIWLRGPSIAKGYWNRPDATEETFGARIAGTGEGPFLRTGDLGFLYSDHLYITGRHKDLIIVRGRNYYPQDLELTAEQSHEALTINGSAAFSIEVDRQERVVLVAELERTTVRTVDAEAVFTAMRRAITETHELQAYSLVLIKPSHLPKTSSGKVQRSKARQMYLEGAFDAVAEWTHPDPQALDVEALEGDEPSAPQAPDLSERPVTEATLRAWMVHHLAEKLQREPGTLKPDMSFMDYGLDSVDAAELTEKLETQLGVTLDIGLFWDYPSINAVVEQLMRTLGQDRPPAEQPEASPATTAAEEPAAEKAETSENGSRKGSWMQRLFKRSG